MSTWLRRTPDAFLVAVPVPFSFGSVLAMIAGSVLARVNALPMPTLGHDVPATLLDHNLWLATALLGVTFTFLAWRHDYFRLWRLARAATSAVPPPVHDEVNDGTTSATS